jgi:Fur family transcriptional regulator, peroxide stress response regulator
MYPERDRQSMTAEAARRLSRFREALRKAGVRMTPQRLGIFIDVVRSVEHPDAESIHKRVRRRMPGVSLDTVYRNLWLLNDLGLITTVGPYREKARFDGRAGSHPHFVCKKCGTVFDIGVRAPAGREVRDAARVLGRVDQVRVEFIGLCRQCLPLTDTPKKGRIARKRRKG